MVNLFEAMEKVKQITLETGLMQKANLGRADLAVETKSSGIDLVTEIDKASEQSITEFILRHFPGHSILAEESGLTESDSDYRWIIDPLDGTTNYSQGLPIFSISIALQFRGETVLGVVFCPVTEELFTAIKGNGAYLNGERIHVAAKTELIDSVLATAFPYDIADNPMNNVYYFSEIVLKARAVRRMGSSAYDLACVATGKFDGFWVLKLSPWDVAAGILLVEEASGKVIHFRADRGISIIAGNAAICGKLQDEITRIDQMK